MLNSQRKAQRGGLAHHLDGLTLEWVLDGMLGKKALQSRVIDGAAVEALLDYLYRHIGMDAGFLNFFLGQQRYTFDSIGNAFSGWLICVEYVHGLKQEPDLQSLQALHNLSYALRKTCRRLLDYLRNRYPETYEEKLLLVEARLEIERDQIRAKNPDKTDSFWRAEINSQDQANPLPTQQSNNVPKLATYLVEAKALRAVLGHSRLQVRLRCEPIDQNVLANSIEIAIALSVSGRNDICLSIKEAIGAELLNQQVYLTVGDEWVELFFDLKGDRNERVQVEVFHPDGVEEVKPILLSDFFTVSGQGPEKPQVTVVNAVNSWQTGIEDLAIRDVFMHLQTHGTLTEAELIHMLGSPRNARRFTRDFDELVQKVPFSVRIETNSSGKRYVRQDG